MKQPCKATLDTQGNVPIAIGNGMFHLTIILKYNTNR